ncbi:MAG: DUF6794 domain-containing protein [Pyrinomonadaceae bacterium]|nr:hypothetical protein [Chloracidobacterium sp.]
MKSFPFLFLFLFSVITINAQMHSSAVEIWTLYSGNGQYYLKSIPWDDESPSLRGTTSVYRKGNSDPLYSFARGFDDAEKNQLVLSNDGSVIFYAITWGADESKEGLKSITIYKKGVITKSFTESELTGCDENKEHCGLLYNNYDKVVDIEKTRSAHRTIFKDNVSNDERFLYDHPIVSSGDIVYLIDPYKKVHRFDLNTGSYLGSIPLDSVFNDLRSVKNQIKVESQRFESPIFLDFPKLRSGKDSYQTLAASLGMKVYDSSSKKDEVYKKYGFKINGYLRQDGFFELENIEIFDDLPKDKIAAFFASNRFVSSEIPSVFEKWHVRDEYFFFRKVDNGLARKERQFELKEERENFKKRLIAEKIGDRYIPANLGECFVELDKLMSEINKNDMKSLKTNRDMIQYHMGLGMWMRNNWGLWGGSRLQKYFTDKGITHPDNMSSVVLFFYWDWLNGKKESWKSWEKNPKQEIY